MGSGSHIQTDGSRGPCGHRSKAQPEKSCSGNGMWAGSWVPFRGLVTPGNDKKKIYMVTFVYFKEGVVEPQRDL